MRPPSIGMWIKESRGHVAAIFALILFPLLFVVSATIDTARQIAASRHIQVALDAAALAGARAVIDQTLSQDDIIALTKSSFLANSSAAHNDVSCGDLIVDVDRDYQQVDIEIKCRMPKLFGNVFATGPHLEIARSANSEHGAPTLDVALMVDMSGSMNSHGRLEALKASASTFVSTLVTDESAGRVRVSLIPYGEAVDAGVYGDRAQGKADDDDSDGDGDRVCVSHRENPITAFTDAAPTDSNYVGDLAGLICNVPTISPLSSDATALASAIDEFAANGYGTAGQIGLAWSWYSISSNWSSIWPDASKPKNNALPRAHKAIVMFTDGSFNRHHEYGGREELARSPSDVMALCKNILHSGVSIYVIGLNVENLTRPWIDQDWLDVYGPDVVLETCAGESDRLFRPESADELQALYETIAKKLEIEPLRLR